MSAVTNALKPIFIGGYMMLLMGATGYSGWMIHFDGNMQAWGGVLLTSAPILLTLSWLMAFRPTARTSARFPSLNALGAIGVALAAWAWISRDAGWLALLLATTSWGGFWLYAYWFSSFGGRRPSTKLVAGSRLPHFALHDVHGNVVTSEQLTDRPAILIFYRGNWCPLCMAQIRELAERYREIDALGVRVALISPQPHGNTVGLAGKFGVKFDFLTDAGNAAARMLGIAHPNGLPMGMQMLGYDSETVLPTVVITGRDGRIVWTHETDNYRVRPEPDTYLEVLRGHGLHAA
ncbi:MAG: peroxiredoxin-like family protein [Ectothiorhodospiraceae bacterium]|jgi:peroxiredoxin|nr:peroxiredoxin-like family protein [Ectothiorhodospiraceae bacterium]